jgi:steroid 5-alpha reductase family enzyme
MVCTAAFGGLFVLYVALWLWSLYGRDVSIVDIFWGPAFVVIALVALATAGTPTPRRLLAVALTTIWALRLAAYIGWRNHGKGEDYRYQSMRKRIGPRFVWLSLVLVFFVQGLLAWIVSLPLQAAILAPAPASLGALDLAGALLWAVGLFFESVGDWQLARFKRDPASTGRVMDRGLWRYTRHPNYFGDFLIWWGFWLLAAQTGAWWTAIGPALMSLFLLRVSGVALLERTIVHRRPDYAAYISRTSPFFPLPPRSPAQ